ncbi:MAG: neutral zinc metallopeptidase [Acidobacteriota bacterium]
MLWKDRRQSDNVEDRRGISRGGMAVGGGLGGIVVLVIALLLGADPGELLEQVPSGAPGSGSGTSRPTNPEEAELRQFVGAALADTEDVWTAIFRKSGKRYTAPTLVLFTDQVRSGCGIAGSAVGPFYCPSDRKVYIDLSFYRELKTRFRAPGDFAQAYVMAHEIGHHIQNLLGTMEKVNAAQGRLRKEGANQLSVRLELQADFLAGVWAHHAKSRGIVEPGDIEEALQAASAIGDDRLQRQSQGYVVPDSFTHGTSEQRLRWFRKGFDTGDISQGDTFSATAL